MASTSAPVSALPPATASPIERAMAAAVTAWSPVIIFTRMPAEWQAATARMASSRGGSMMPASASSVRPVFDIGEGEFALALLHGHTGEGQDTEALGRQGVDQRMPERGVDGFIFTGLALLGAHADEPFRGALDEGEGVTGVVVMQRRHEAVLGLERDDVDARQVFRLECAHPARP